jgi:hypothetical protein
MSGLTIDWETADRITLACLKDQLETLETELKDHIENGKWMHPEDVANSVSKYIPSLKTLIDYYGG